MTIRKDVVFLYIGIMVGVFGNLFVSFLIESMKAVFENSKWVVFWSLGFIISSVSFFQVLRFSLKYFNVPNNVLLLFHLASIVMVILGIVMILPR